MPGGITPYYSEYMMDLVLKEMGHLRSWYGMSMNEVGRSQKVRWTIGDDLVFITTLMNASR